MLFGPLAQGRLLNKFDPKNPPKFGDGDIRGGGEVQNLVRVALQYALAQSPLACVIPGFKNARQVDSNAEAAAPPLTADEGAFVKQALQG